jgi:hypothetical protein
VGDVTDVPGIELADFVAGLRAQIREAQRDADPALPIEVGPVTVELTVMSRREGEGHLGVQFWVVDAGVSGSKATESTQRITIQLQPLAPGADGAGGGRNARISDTTSQPPRHSRADVE